MTRHPIGAAVVYGTPQTIMPEEFDHRILSAVKENLEKFEQSYRSELAPRFTEKEDIIFRRTHQIVSLQVDDDGIVEIVELERIGAAKIITFQKSELDAKLIEALKEIF